MVYPNGRTIDYSNGSGYATAPTMSFVGGGGSGAVGTAILGSWNLIHTNLNNDFVRYVAAATSDTELPINDNEYAGLAEANWQANYQGAVQNRVFTPSAPLAITGDTSFSSTVIQGVDTVPTVLFTSTSANTAAGVINWQQAATSVPLSVVSEKSNGGFSAATDKQTVQGLSTPSIFSDLTSRQLSDDFSLIDTSSEFSDWPSAWIGNSGYGMGFWTGSELWTLENGLWNG